MKLKRLIPILPILPVALALGCNMPALIGSSNTPTPSPTVTLTASAPNLTATALEGTLVAVAAESTAARQTLVSVEMTATAGAKPSPSSTPTLDRSPASPATTPAAPTTPASTLPAPDAPAIVSFEASPTEIDPGDAVTLSWEAVGEKASLCSVLRTGQLSQCWDVPLVGSQEVTTHESDRNFVMWVLFAQVGNTTESATASVTLRCPDTWFFDPPPEACPNAPATVSGGAAQHFERGLMIWVATWDHIFVLFSDGQSPDWDRLADPWSEGMPENDPGIVPPPGLYQPVRGFGMIWRGEGGGWNIRGRLGWALAPEFAIDTAYQCDSAPKYLTCYLQGPDGVIVLEPERSGWYLWAGPH